MNPDRLARAIRRLAELDRQRADLLEELAGELAPGEPAEPPPRRPRRPAIVAPCTPVTDLQRAQAARGLRRAGLVVRGKS